MTLRRWTFARRNNCPECAADLYVYVFVAIDHSVWWAKLISRVAAMELNALYATGRRWEAGLRDFVETVFTNYCGMMSTNATSYHSWPYLLLADAKSNGTYVGYISIPRTATIHVSMRTAVRRSETISPVSENDGDDDIIEVVVSPLDLSPSAT